MAPNEAPQSIQQPIQQPITLEHLIGMQTCEIFALRQQLAEAQHRIQELEEQQPRRSSDGPKLVKEG